MRGAVKWPMTAVVFFALLGTGFILLREGSRPEAEVVKAREPLPVTALRIERRPFVLEGGYSARLSAVRDVTVTAKAGGTVEEDLVSEGDRVAEGQALYRLDDDAYRFTVQQAEAALELARENLRKVQNVSRPELLRRLEALLEESEAVLRKAEIPVKAYGKRDSNHSRLNNDLGKPDDPATQEFYKFLDALVGRK